MRKANKNINKKKHKTTNASIYKNNTDKQKTKNKTKTTQSQTNKAYNKNGKQTQCTTRGNKA